MSVCVNFNKELVAKEKFFLTVAIPTFNRAEHLKVCLERFGSEYISLSSEKRKLFSIYISNNASTDNTENVILDFMRKYPGLAVSKKNLENIGGDQNIVNCYMAAESSYIWIFGDDDAIIKGSLNKILDVMLKNELDILFIPCRSYNDINAIDGEIEASKVKIYSDASLFSRRVNINLTFISALVVRSNSFSEAEALHLKGSNLSQLGWVFSLLKYGKRFAVIENKMIAAKAANTGGYGLIKVFGSNLRSLTNILLNDQPRISRALENSVIIDFFPPHILALRKGKSDFDLESDMANELHRLFCKNWRYYVFIVPMLFIPVPVSELYNYPLRLFRRLLRSKMI